MKRPKNLAKKIWGAIAALIVVFFVIYFRNSSQAIWLFKKAFPLTYSAHGLKIMALGDSLTAGTITLSPTESIVGGGYRWPLWELIQGHGLNLHFVGSEIDGPENFPEPFHEGHLGLRSDQLLMRLPVILSKHQPDLILLMVGTNDLFQDYPPNAAIESISAALDFIFVHLPNCRVLFSAPISSLNSRLEKKIVSFNRDLEKIILRRPEVNNRLFYVDLHREARLGIHDYSDEIHLNKSGYKKVAEVWFTHLEIILNFLPPSK